MSFPCYWHNMTTYSTLFHQIMFIFLLLKQKILVQQPFTFNSVPLPFLQNPHPHEMMWKCKTLFTSLNAPYLFEVHTINLVTVYVICFLFTASEKVLFWEVWEDACNIDDDDILEVRTRCMLVIMMMIKLSPLKPHAKGVLVKMRRWKYTCASIS